MGGVRVSAQRPRPQRADVQTRHRGKKKKNGVAAWESNPQPTVSPCYCAQNSSHLHESSSFHCVRYPRFRPVAAVKLQSLTSAHFSSALRLFIITSRHSPRLLCCAPLPPEEEFHLQSSARLHRAHAHTHAGRRAMLILKTIECSKRPAPSSRLPQNTPLLAGKHTFTQIFLPIWSHADGALRQRRV